MSNDLQKLIADASAGLDISFLPPGMAERIAQAALNDSAKPSKKRTLPPGMGGRQGE